MKDIEKIYNTYEELKHIGIGRELYTAGLIYNTYEELKPVTLRYAEIALY